MRPLEIDISLRSLQAWRTLRSEQPWVSDPSSSVSIVETAQSEGIISPHLGAVSADEIILKGRNFRESFLIRGLNPRARAILECLECQLGDGKRSELQIYSPEAVTAFARHMSRNFPGYYGSEYMPEPKQSARFPSVPHQDLAALSLSTASMDYVLCNDVFEHLPDLHAAIREMARVLRPGGQLLATFPFAYERQQSIHKASFEDGVVHFHTDPEYHADPVDPERGSLVFQIPGWEVLTQFEAGGFRDVEMRFIASARMGICAQHAAGIFVLRAVR